jgi:hypothetical protein
LFFPALSFKIALPETGEEETGDVKRATREAATIEVTETKLWKSMFIIFIQA